MTRAPRRNRAGSREMLRADRFDQGWRHFLTKIDFESAAPTPRTLHMAASTATPPCWLYDQASGEITTPANFMLGNGYSGRGKGLNNPLMDGVADVGPIPRGDYAIGKFFDDPHGKGPQVCQLTPLPGTDMLGRSGFMIHGDTEAANFTASEGCIIAPRYIRDAIALSTVRTLRVI